uniref:PH domain-containing protein n=1 Tax=Acrobeloides nanus TaxID=290746 RepID=A0A914EAY0_9BILA
MSNISTPINEKENRLAAFLFKYENRTIIGGPGKKKFWFVLSLDSPYLYWYKNSEDLNCVGRLLLTGAAFTFDPRQHGRFEIHINEEIHILEASDNKSRIKWLQMLQKNRKRHYESENVEEILNSEIVSLTSYSNLIDEKEQTSTKSFSNVDNVSLFEELSSAEAPTSSQETRKDEQTDMNNSIFYLNSDGELNRKSLEVPASIQTNKVIKTADDILGRLTEESQKVKNLEEASKKVLSKARVSFRMPSFSNSTTSQKNCDQCKELMKIVDIFKNQCVELTDEAIAHSELIAVLRQSVISAHNQRDALKRLENASDLEKLDFTLERESAITALHLTNAELKRANQTLKEQVR